MRKISLFLAISVILVLDWLALDDITTGREPSFALEWTLLIVSVPILWALLKLARKQGPVT